MKIGDVYKNATNEWAVSSVRLVKHYTYRNVWLVQYYSPIEGKWADIYQEYSTIFLMDYCIFKYVDHEYIDSLIFKPHYVNRLELISEAL